MTAVVTIVAAVPSNTWLLLCTTGNVYVSIDDENESVDHCLLCVVCGCAELLDIT
jgi:hypothetical protein